MSDPFAWVGIFWCLGILNGVTDVAGGFNSISSPDVHSFPTGGAVTESEVSGSLGAL